MVPCGAFDLFISSILIATALMPTEQIAALRDVSDRMAVYQIPWRLNGRVLLARVPGAAQHGAKRSDALQTRDPGYS